VFVDLRGDSDLYPKSSQLIKIASVGSVPHIDLTPVQLLGFDPANHAPHRRQVMPGLPNVPPRCLGVPYLPSPESWNYLLNPLHPDASKLSIEWAKHITYDRLLFRLSN
jgi:hypothetical protein